VIHIILLLIRALFHTYQTPEGQNDFQSRKSEIFYGNL